jgi:hypothetical protein
MGAQGTDDQHGQRRAADREQHVGRSGAGGGHSRHGRGNKQAHRAERHDGGNRPDLQDDQRLHAARAAQSGQGGEREQQRADRHREPARGGDDAVRADEDPRRGHAVNGEQRGHRRERGAEQHGAAVVAARARDGQGERRDGGDRRRDGDEPEVQRRRRHDHVLAGGQGDDHRREGGGRDRQACGIEAEAHLLLHRRRGRMI